MRTTGHHLARTAAAAAAAAALSIALVGPAVADHGPGRGGDDGRTSQGGDDRGGDRGDDRGGDDRGGDDSSDDNSDDAVAAARHLDLPAGFLPEGIAIAADDHHRGGRDDHRRGGRDRRTTTSAHGDRGGHGGGGHGSRGVAYLGSRADGDIVRLDLRTGASTVITQGPGTPSLGMKVDDRGRLFVAGGTGGDARVVDTRTGAVLASYRLVEGTAFVNDVVLTRDAAWFTDSANAQLVKVPLGRHGALPTQADVVRVPLTGAWQQVTGTNANGITTTPDGRALLVVNSTTGVLYRVDPATGAATVVDLGGASPANGDGLLLEGRTLYVVQNRINTIAVVQLSRQGTSGRVAGTITDADLDVPTTLARSGDRLYTPNARFTTPATPTTAYWVTGLEVGHHR